MDHKETYFVPNPPKHENVDQKRQPLPHSLLSCLSKRRRLDLFPGPLYPKAPPLRL